MWRNLPPRSWQKEFYKSKAWKLIRSVVIKRDLNICQECDSLILEKAVVHHIEEITMDNYLDENVTLNVDNLETLCFKCHNKVHFLLKKGIKIRRKKVTSVDYEKRDRFSKYRKGVG